MKQRPNILFVFSDQHRKHSLACYGNDQVISPNFDRFANDGLKFNNCIANSPVCVPMRGSILTSMFAWNHRAISNDLPINQDVRSIVDVLNENSYNTGYIGKWHLGGVPRDKAIPSAERLGFKEWKVANCNHAYDKGYYFDENDIRHEMNEFESIEQTDMAIDFIQRNSKNESPWGLFLSWGPPHAPFNAVPQKYLDMYDPEKIKLRENVPPDNILLSKKRPTLNAEDIRKQYHGYYALITLLDEQFGRLLAELDKLGISEDTIIVYTSDHGDMLGSNAMCKKQLPHEESIAVPLLISWEGKTFVGTSNELISLTDLAVSLTNLSGIAWDKETDGDNLSKLFTDPNFQGPEERIIYDLIPCHQAADRGGKEWVGLRTCDMTFTRDATGSDNFLFTNSADPLQMDNLCSNEKYTQKKEQLSSRLDEILAEYGYTFRPWEQMVIQDGYLEKWNESQLYFNRNIIKKKS